MGREATRPFEDPGAKATRSHLWSDFSFVMSSRHRESVLRAVAKRPHLPRQVAEETHLRLAHVSRALRELRDHSLVELLTPEAKGRGRLYAVTDAGSTLVKFLHDSSQQYVPGGRSAATVGFVPRIRAAICIRAIAHLRAAKGDPAVRNALKGWSVSLDDLHEDDWISANALDEFLELLEGAFGDGTYELVRSVAAVAAPAVGTVKEQIIKILPLSALAERAPIVYGREWNYGRLEVKTGKRWAAFRHFDWMPTPAMCALFEGVYRGILRGRKVEGTVTKTRCVRDGDRYCEYLVEW